MLYKRVFYWNQGLPPITQNFTYIPPHVPTLLNYKKQDVFLEDLSQQNCLSKIGFNLFFGGDHQTIFFQKNFKKHFSTLHFDKVFRRFRIPGNMHNQVWGAFFSLFYTHSFPLFHKTILKLFDLTRVDNHGMVIRFIIKFFRLFPYHSLNTAYLRIKIKGKMSRKGVARTKTIYLKRYFLSTKSVFSFKKYYFMLVARTGSTCFLCSIKYNH